MLHGWSYVSLDIFLEAKTGIIKIVEFYLLIAVLGIYYGLKKWYGIPLGHIDTRTCNDPSGNRGDKYLIAVHVSFVILFQILYGIDEVTRDLININIFKCGNFIIPGSLEFIILILNKACLIDQILNGELNIFFGFIRSHIRACTSYGLFIIRQYVDSDLYVLYILGSVLIKAVTDEIKLPSFGYRVGNSPSKSSAVFKELFYHFNFHYPSLAFVLR